MRKLLLALAPLLVVLLSAGQASAWVHHHRVQTGYYPVTGAGVPMGASAQALPPWLVNTLVTGAMNFIPQIPGLLQQGGFGGGGGGGGLGGGAQPGGSAASTPVPKDVAGSLNDVDSTLDKLKDRNQKLLDSVLPPTLKGRSK